MLLCVRRRSLVSMETHGALALDGVHDPIQRVAAWFPIVADAMQRRSLLPRARAGAESHVSKLQQTLLGNREGFVLDPSAISTDAWDTLLTPGVRRELRAYLHSPILIGLRVICVPPFAGEQEVHSDVQMADLHENANIIFTTDAVVPLTTLFDLRPPKRHLQNIRENTYDGVRASMRALGSSCVMFDGAALHAGAANTSPSENTTRVLADFYNGRLLTEDPMHLFELVECNVHAPPPIKAYTLSEGDAGGLGMPSMCADGRLERSISTSTIFCFY